MVKGWILGLSIIGLSFTMLIVGCEKNNEEKEVKTHKQDKQVEAGNKEIQTQTPTKSDSEQIQQAVKDMLEKGEKEDFDGYISHLAEIQRENEQGRKDLKDLFKHFDIDYEVMQMDEPVLLSSTTATVKVKQKAMAKKTDEGYSFTNHISEYEHTLVKEKDGWKVANSTLLAVQYLDKDGNPVPEEKEKNEETEKETKKQ